MHNFLIVHVTKRTGRLADEVNRFHRRQTAFLFQVKLQVEALDQLQGHEVDAVPFAAFIKAHDVFMLELSPQPAFAMKTFQRVGFHG